MNFVSPVTLIAIAMLGLASVVGAQASQLWPEVEVLEDTHWNQLRGVASSWTNSGQYFVPQPADLSQVAAIAMGYAHTLALQGDGTVVAWGFNRQGQATVPTGLTGVKAVAACYDHSLALKNDGTVVAWGDYFDGVNLAPVSLPTGLSGVTAIAAGYDHSAALTADGNVVVWGMHQPTVTHGAYGSVAYTAIAAGNGFTAALRSDQQILVWGSSSPGSTANPYGLGDIPPGLSGVVALAAGTSNIAALKADGTVVEWGINDSHQCDVPAGLHDVVAVSVGEVQTLALKRDGSYVAWGYSGSVPFTGPVSAIATGGFAAVIRVSPIELDLPHVGATSERWIRITNPSTTTTITGLRAVTTASDQGTFSLGTPLPSALAPGQTVQVPLHYTAATANAASSNLQIFTAASALPAIDSQLIVSSSPPPLTVVSSLPSTGTSYTPLGTSSTVTVTITNNGTRPFTNPVFSLSGGADPGDFSLGPLPAVTSLAPGASMSIAVTFTPASEANGHTQLFIGSADTNASPVVVDLYGKGTHVDLREVNPDDPNSIVQATNIAMPRFLLGSVVVKSYTLRNAGTKAFDSLRLAVVRYNSSPYPMGITVVKDLPATLAPGETAAFTLRFTTQKNGYDSGRISITWTEQNDPYPYHGSAGFYFSATVGTQGLSVLSRNTLLPLSNPIDNTVVAWGSNTYGQATVPAGLKGVTAVAAGEFHSLALKRDSTVVAWGSNSSGQCAVPPGLSGVTAIAAGSGHSLALKSDGTVVFWGDSQGGIPNTVPAGLTDVFAIAAAGHHSLALRRNGTVVAWGANDFHQSAVPKRLGDVVAIAAGSGHSVALKGNGTVVAWGDNGNGQCKVPSNLGPVMAIAAGNSITAALRPDSGITAWGQLQGTLGNSYNSAALAAGGDDIAALTFNNALQFWGASSAHQTTPPARLDRPTAIACGGSHSLAITAAIGDFDRTKFNQYKNDVLEVRNTGTLPLNHVTMVIEGPDADQWWTDWYPSVRNLDGGYTWGLYLSFRATRAGPLNATLRISSSDLSSPFLVPLKATGTLTDVAYPSSLKNYNLTYGPITPDRATGQMLQRITFVNPTGQRLNGLRLILSGITPGVTVSSSSAGEQPGSLEVLYTNPIEQGASFNLAYFDPLRRTAASLTPLIRSEPLEAPEPQPGPVDGTLIQLLAIRDTPEGPLLQWNTVRGGVYVVEYSDDQGATWHSAVHRLGTGGAHLFWVDRGQPETQTKPLNKAARMYRVKKV